MRRLFIALLLLGLGHAHADEATKLKLQDPRYAEPTPKSTLKIAAEVRSARPPAPDYPILKAEPSEPESFPYWGVALAVAFLGAGSLYLQNRRKGKAGG